MKVYKRLKIYLDKNNITQKKLSELTGISEGTLSLILRGGRKFECDELQKVVTALKVPPETFIKYDEAG